MRNALVLQAATPTAISVLLLAESRDQDHNIVSILILFSTIIAILTIMIWFLLLQ